MSNDINKLIISGRLIKDPQRTEVMTQNGPITLLRFTIANQIYRNNESNFFDCNFWGKRADYFSNKLNKGTHVVIEGELKQDRWKDKNTSENKSRIVINVVSIFIFNSERFGPSKNPESPNKENPNNGHYQQDIGQDNIPIKKADEIVGEQINTDIENFNGFNENEFNDIDDYDGLDSYENENNNYYH
ncbi:MAG TPA: single-stranded DNA-binding protein [Exilispira sp.]|nr:single-stranded DNA-binding protein [Exilispira sp.]